MADRTVAGLRAAIKSLKDTVAPAIDPANPLANEQSRMVCGYLALVCEQLPQRSARIAFELRGAVALAESMLPLAAGCDDEIARTLATRCATARALRDDPERIETDVEHATQELNAAISALVRAAAGAGTELRRQVERAALTHAQAWLTAQRAWFAPLGFDLERAELPPLADAVSSC